tara:strand:+ start:26 stop:307 length:282 start_codon:yes stop_codon:yes gene_type:complete
MEMGTKTDYMKEEKDSIFLICDCFEHGLLVEKFKDEDEVSISLFERGLRGRILGWRERLRWCWQILRHGRPWSDFVILNTDNQKSLKEFLTTK